MVRITLLISAGVLMLAACTGDAGEPGSPPLLEESQSGMSSALPSRAMSSRFSAADDCPVMAPNELPNGRPPGSRRPFPLTSAKSFLDVWGHGSNRVVIGRGEVVVDQYDRHDRPFPRTGEPVVGRDGIKRWVIAVGDPPLGQIAYKYLVDSCPYLIWTQPGLTWENALGYAARLATSLEDDSPRRPQLVQDERAPVARDLQRLAEVFVRYAVGDSDSFPHWESVSMSIGGQVVGSIDDIDAALSNRDIWKICPADGDAYGASSCPVDLLGPINGAVVNDASLVYSAEHGDVVCAPTRSGPLPRGRLVVLRPSEEWRSCASDFALALTADEKGRLRNIDLTLSEP